MCKIKYYFVKLNENIRKNFSYKRVKEYGFRMAFLDFLIFLMHRNDTRLEHWLIRKKDMIVQKYIYRKYPNIINEIRGYPFNS